MKVSRKDRDRDREGREPGEERLQEQSLTVGISTMLGTTSTHVLMAAAGLSIAATATTIMLVKRRMSQRASVTRQHKKSSWAEFEARMYGVRWPMLPVESYGRKARPSFSGDKSSLKDVENPPACAAPALLKIMPEQQCKTGEHFSTAVISPSISSHVAEIEAAILAANQAGVLRISDMGRALIQGGVVNTGSNNTLGLALEVVSEGVLLTMESSFTEGVLLLCAAPTVVPSAFPEGRGECYPLYRLPARFSAATAVSAANQAGVLFINQPPDIGSRTMGLHLELIVRGRQSVCCEFFLDELPVVPPEVARPSLGGVEKPVLSSRTTAIGEMEIPTISTVHCNSIMAEKHKFHPSLDVSEPSQREIETVFVYPDMSDELYMDTDYTSGSASKSLSSVQIIGLDLDSPSTMSNSDFKPPHRGLAGAVGIPKSKENEGVEVLNESRTNGSSASECSGEPTAPCTCERLSSAELATRSIHINRTRPLGAHITLLPSAPNSPPSPTTAPPRSRLPRTGSPRWGRPSSPAHRLVTPASRSPPTSPSRPQSVRASVLPAVHSTTTCNHGLDEVPSAAHHDDRTQFTKPTSPTRSRAKTAGNRIHRKGRTSIEDTDQPPDGSEKTTNISEEQEQALSAKGEENVDDEGQLPLVLTVHTPRALKPESISFRVVHASGLTLQGAFFRLDMRTHQRGRGCRSVSWSVYRQYDDFLGLQKFLKRRCPPGTAAAATLPTLPCVEKISRKDSTLVLQEYLNDVATGVPFAWGVREFVMFLDDAMGRNLFGCKRSMARCR